MVTINAFSPNAIGSSFASLKTPDSKDSVAAFSFVFNSSKFVSTLSGIILNCIPAVAIYGPLCPHLAHLYSIDRLRHLLHRSISFLHFGHGNFTMFVVSFSQLVHFILGYSYFGL